MILLNIILKKLKNQINIYLIQLQKLNQIIILIKKMIYQEK